MLNTVWLRIREPVESVANGLHLHKNREVAHFDGQRNAILFCWQPRATILIFIIINEYLILCFFLRLFSFIYFYHLFTIFIIYNEFCNAKDSISK